MNKIYKIKAYFIVMLAMIATVSCSDSDNWEAGPQAAADNPGVFFNRYISRVIEVEANQEGVLRKDFFTIELGRDDFKSSTALQVPITIHHADPNLTVSEMVEFKAGESTADLKINIGEFEFNTQYDLSLEINENFAHPYKKYEDMENVGSSRLDAKIEVVSVVGVATFTPVPTSGSRMPEFYPFEHNIYDNQDGTYTIKNFLYNNAGFDFGFEVDDENNIWPLEDYGYHDTDSQRWYFYSANSSASLCISLTSNI